MKKASLLIALAGLLVMALAASHAENSPLPPAISQERMQQIYEEVKTPYKYGVVLRGEAAQLLDSPSIFGRTGRIWRGSEMMPRPRTASLCLIIG